MLFSRRRSVSQGQASGWRRRASRGVFEVDSLVEPGTEEVVYPRSRCSLDRMRTPRLEAARVWNHARARGSICRKSHPQRAQTGEYEYLSRAKPHARSEAYEFFTDDYIDAGTVRASAKGYSS